MLIACDRMRSDRIRDVCNVRKSVNEVSENVLRWYEHARIEWLSLSSGALAAIRAIDAEACEKSGRKHLVKRIWENEYSGRRGVGRSGKGVDMSVSALKKGIQMWSKQTKLCIKGMHGGALSRLTTFHTSRDTPLYDAPLALNLVLGISIRY